ncbi:MAG: septal ring lytic transglycosylase RlpA family protein [bacterium]
MTPEANGKKVRRQIWQIAWIFGVCLIAPACQTRILIQKPSPRSGAEIFSSTPTLVEYGTASWYGGRWIGRSTANGETYRSGDLTAAHRKLPFNTPVRVVDLKTGHSVIVRINNRGPYVKGRIIDLSVAAAKQLGTYNQGLAKVRIEALREIPLLQKSNVKALHPPKPPAMQPAPNVGTKGQKREASKTHGTAGVP